MYFKFNPHSKFIFNFCYRKFSKNIDFLRYHRIKTAIASASSILHHKTYFPSKSDLGSPKMPVIHKIGCMQSKGCRVFYETLSGIEKFQNSTIGTESKWHEELGYILSVDTWDKIWKLTKSRILSNKAKWLQIQINHFVLPTNYSVSKYRVLQPPWCSFCSDNNHLERLPFLLWHCPVVQDFWRTVVRFLKNFEPNIILGEKEIIFGDIKNGPESVVNTVLALSEMFLWAQKFTSKRLDSAQYINYLKRELKSIFIIC